MSLSRWEGPMWSTMEEIKDGDRIKILLNLTSASRLLCTIVKWWSIRYLFWSEWSRNWKKRSPGAEGKKDNICITDIHRTSTSLAMMWRKSRGGTDPGFLFPILFFSSIVDEYFLSPFACADSVYLTWGEGRHVLFTVTVIYISTEKNEIFQNASLSITHVIS